MGDKTLLQQGQIQQEIHIQAPQQELEKKKSLNGQNAEFQNKEKGSLEMPIDIEKAKMVENTDDDDLFEKEEETEQKESVAMNGTYQKINGDFFGGDGHYMKALKKELNEGVGGENDGLVALAQYSVDQIQELQNPGLLKGIQKKMETISSICNKYVFFHPFAWSQKAKKRKADVKNVYKNAQARLKACKERIKELDEEAEAHKDMLKQKDGTALDQATTGGRQVWNYVGAGLGFTLGNIWNSVGMVASTPVWLVASAFKSLFKRSWSSAFHIPHPQSYSNWYKTVCLNQEQSINKKMIKNNANDDSDNKFEYIYTEPSSVLRKNYWHKYLVMK